MRKCCLPAYADSVLMHMKSHFSQPELANLAKSYRQDIKKLARGYIKLGDTPRQAMKDACAFYGQIHHIIGNSIPDIHRSWANRRKERLAAGKYDAL